MNYHIEQANELAHNITDTNSCNLVAGIRSLTDNVDLGMVGLRGCFGLFELVSTSQILNYHRPESLTLTSILYDILYWLDSQSHLLEWKQLWYLDSISTAKQFNIMTGLQNGVQFHLVTWLYWRCEVDHH
jgi:hypothetical protein